MGTFILLVMLTNPTCHSVEAHEWAYRHHVELECDGYVNEDTEAEDEDLTDAQIEAKYNAAK